MRLVGSYWGMFSITIYGIRVQFRNQNKLAPLRTILMIIHGHLLFFPLLLLFLGSSAGLEVLKNTTNHIILSATDGDAKIQYSFSLQRNTFMVRMNVSIGSERLPASDFGILPNVFIEANSSVLPEESTSVRGFLHFESFDKDWNSGLILSQRNNDVYEIDGSWNSPTNRSLNYRFQMYVTSRATVYRGIRLNPNEITWISTIVDFPYRLKDSFLALDEIFLSEVPLTNGTTSAAYVFSSDNVTQLYINTTALIDGRNEDILIANIRPDSFWSHFEGGTNTTRNLSGRNVDDALIIFLGSRDAKNITFQQRLAYNLDVASAASVKNRGGRTRVCRRYLVGALMVTSLLLSYLM